MIAFKIFLVAVLLYSGCVCISVTNNTTWDYTVAKNRPLVIAHRGYSSLFPENTLEAFRAAIYAGADFFELDIQVTKDNVLLVSHDATLSRVTDVANRTEFKNKKSTKFIDGQNVTDWFICDFTLAEVKTLKIKQVQVKGRDQDLNTYFTFPSLRETIEMLVQFNKQHQGKRNLDNRIAGVVIESKNRDFYLDNYNFEQGARIVDLLREFNLHTMYNASLYAPIILHSFDAPTVQLWHNITDLPNSQLGRIESLPYSLQQTSLYATTVGLEISSFYNNTSQRPTGVVDQVKAAGLQIHGWTFRDDQLTWGKDSIDQYVIACQTLNITGIISEFPEAAISVAVMIRRQNEKLFRDNQKITSQF
ncbi:hypothetical protein ABPG74_020002 [Tetrahymena malaccensis]